MFTEFFHFLPLKADQLFSWVIFIGCFSKVRDFNCSGIHFLFRCLLFLCILTGTNNGSCSSPSPSLLGDVLSEFDEDGSSARSGRQESLVQTTSRRAWNHFPKTTVLLKPLDSGGGFLCQNCLLIG